MDSMIQSYKISPHSLNGTFSHLLQSFYVPYPLYLEFLFLLPLFNLFKPYEGQFHFHDFSALFSQIFNHKESFPPQHSSATLFKNHQKAKPNDHDLHQCLPVPVPNF